MADEIADGDAWSETADRLGNTESTVADRFATRIYYEDQTDWRAADYYALFRYFNRLFLNQRDIKTAEIAALDLSRMSAETRYLMKHMLVLKKAYEPLLQEYSNLRALEDVGELGNPLYLDEKPIGVYDYFTKRGIYL